MNTPSPYQQVLFVGPGLRDGSQGQAFAAALRTLRGAAPNERIIDTLHSFDGLWQALQAPRQHLGEQVLVVDLEPASDSAYLDWLRDELARRAAAHPQAPRLWVTASALGRRGLEADAVCADVARSERHLPCERVAPVAADPGWEHPPAHARHLFLCTGPRCVRRGALARWKTLRRHLLDHHLVETPGGVLLTRTACQFPCNRGPLLTVYPDACWYRIATDDDARRLVDEHLLGNRPVAALLIHPPPGGVPDA